MRCDHAANIGKEIEMQKPKTVDNLSGHITQAERERREKAESKMKRESINVEMPDYLDDVGAEVWERLMRDGGEIMLYDNLDADTIGSYCSVTSRIISLRQKYRSAVTGHRKTTDVLDISKELRLLEALQLSYAVRLGMTPESRARLAARPTVEEDTSDENDIYG